MIFVHHYVALFLEPALPVLTCPESVTAAVPRFGGGSFNWTQEVDAGAAMVSRSRYTEGQYQDHKNIYYRSCSCTFNIIFF